MLDTRDVGDVRSYVESRADGNGIALPLGSLSCGLGGISDDMFPFECPCHGVDSGVEVNMRPEVEMRAVLIEILDIPLGGHKIPIGL